MKLIASPVFWEGIWFNNLTRTRPRTPRSGQWIRVKWNRRASTSFLRRSHHWLEWGSVCFRWRSSNTNKSCFRLNLAQTPARYLSFKLFIYLCSKGMRGGEYVISLWIHPPSTHRNPHLGSVAWSLLCTCTSPSLVTGAIREEAWFNNFIAQLASYPADYPDTWTFKRILPSRLQEPAICSCIYFRNPGLVPASLVIALSGSLVDIRLLAGVLYSMSGSVGLSKHLRGIKYLHPSLVIT